MGAMCAFGHRQDPDWGEFSRAKDELHRRVLQIYHNTTKAVQTRRFEFEIYNFDKWQKVAVDDR